MIFSLFTKGEDLLATHLNSDEELNMDLVYTVIDFFRHAITLKRGVEVIHFPIYEILFIKPLYQI